MDLSARNDQPLNPAPANGSSSSATSGSPKSRSSRTSKVFENNKLIRVLYAVLLVCVAVLLIAIAFSFAFGPKAESGYVNSSDFQAVDISVGGSTNGDQIYFGNIKTMTSSYIVLENVYYIPTTSSSTSNVTLEPLVCQVDTPVDQMIINRSSMNWWENLQPTSKVSTSIASYEKNNPKGPTCPASSAGSGSTSSSSSTTATTP